jgi:hypothetical protein
MLERETWLRLKVQALALLQHSAVQRIKAEGEVNLRINIV